MDLNTLRVLILAGGGTRGEVHRAWLERYINMFYNGDFFAFLNTIDVIGGTSIGGILAISYAFGKTPTEMKDFFYNKSKRIFTIRRLTVGNNTSANSNKPNAGQKLLLMIDDDPFYKSHAPIPDNVNTYNWSNPSEDDVVLGGDWNDYSNYGSNVLHDLLCKNFNNATLQDLKTKVIIPAVCTSLNKYVYFSNIQNEKYYKLDSKLVDVARATSAAPVYFPEYTIDGLNFSDGGTFANFPVRATVRAGLLIKPLANRICILGLGTGKGELGFQNSDEKGKKQSVGSFKRAMGLFDEASSGSQAAEEFDLSFQRDKFEQEVSYVFNPELDKEQDTELDSSSTKFLTYLGNVAKQDFINNEKEIRLFHNKYIA